MSLFERIVMGILGVLIVPILYGLMIGGIAAIFVAWILPRMGEHPAFFAIGLVVALMFAVVFLITGTSLVVPLVRDSWKMITGRRPW